MEGAGVMEISKIKPAYLVHSAFSNKFLRHSRNSLHLPLLENKTRQPQGKNKDDPKRK